MLGYKATKVAITKVKKRVAAPVEDVIYLAEVEVTPLKPNHSGGLQPRPSL